MGAPIQPGWYADPDDDRKLRYWDGQGWGVRGPQAPKKRNTPLIVLAWVLGGMFLLCGGCGAFVGMVNLVIPDKETSTTATVAPSTTMRATSTAPRTTAIPAPAPTTAPAPAFSQEQLFIITISLEDIEFATDEEMISVGYRVCDMARDGLETGPIGLALMTEYPQGLTIFQAGYFVGASKKAFCPEFA